MGKSITPKYIIVIWDNPKISPNAMVWDCRGKKPTEKQLDDYITVYINSLKVGGCNYHITESLGYIPVPYRAHIVNQKTNEIVVKWNAPAFMAI